jgi:hypothetical protein
MPGRRGCRSRSLPPLTADCSDSTDGSETTDHYHTEARTLGHVKATEALTLAGGDMALADTPRVQHAEYNPSWTGASLGSHSIRHSGEGSGIASDDTSGAWDHGSAASPAGTSQSTGRRVCACCCCCVEDP